MSDHRKAVREAAQIYARNDTFTDAQREEAVLTLAGHGCWSMLQVAAIAGVPRHYVRKHMQKSDRTGGRLNPDTLELILEEFALKDRSESNPKLTERILDMGTSSYELGKLLDQPVSSIKWRRIKAKGVT